MDQVYDAIVIGSGVSGGWAAKACCEKGLKTLVLERGRYPASCGKKQAILLWGRTGGPFYYI